MKEEQEEAIEKVSLLLVSGLGQFDVRKVCVERFGIEPTDVEAVIEEAKRRITVNANYRLDEEVGKAVTRLNDLYARAIRSQDTRGALNAQRELNRLLALYQTGLDDEEGPASPASEELQQIRNHLEPLALGKPASPTVELVRLAVQEILRLRRG